jgi:hypothetical protein
MQIKLKKILNKNKTIWNTVNLETNKTRNTEKINTLISMGIQLVITKDSLCI